jgi:hypothetical protein
MKMKNKKHIKEDISDSPEDENKLKPEETLFDLPELKDIPGAKRSGKSAGQMPGDITISSADEEAVDLLNGRTNPDDSNISPLEKKLLSESFDPSYDTDLPIDSLSLDNRDEDGEQLEEGSLDKDLFGKDLDNDLTREEDEESEGESQQ